MPNEENSRPETATIEVKVTITDGPGSVKVQTEPVLEFHQSGSRNIALKKGPQVISVSGVPSPGATIEVDFQQNGSSLSKETFEEAGVKLFSFNVS